MDIRIATAILRFNSNYYNVTRSANGSGNYIYHADENYSLRSFLRYLRVYASLNFPTIYSVQYLCFAYFTCLRLHTTHVLSGARPICGHDLADLANNSLVLQNP